MKKNMPHLFKPALVLASTLLVMSSTLAQASLITKANNSLDLTNTASWLGGSVPAAGDIAVWNSTVTAANTVNLGASTTWLGIQVANPGGLVTIANDGNTLTNGTSGIDLSSASTGVNNLVLSNNVVLDAGPENWTVASGRTLTLGGSLVRDTGSALRFYLPDLSASGAQVTVTNGVPSTLLSNPTNSTFARVNFATVNDIDFAGLNGSMQVIGGSALGLYTQNIANNANPTLNGTYDVVDFVNTTSYGIRCSGASTYFGFRFNVAQTYTGVNAKWVNGIPAWVNDHTSGRNNTIYSILITTNVGSSAVVDYDGAVDIIGTASTRDLLLFQNNPGAPLIYQTAITETGTNNPAFLNKFGAGTVELENQNSYSGGTRIYEGTLKVDAVGDQTLFTTLAIGAPVAFNVNGSLGVSTRLPVSAFVGSTNSVNVYGGNLTQAAPNTNVIPITVYSGATNTISLSRANLQLREGASGLTENLLNSSTNFVLTFNSGSRLQFAYANGIAPSATVAPLFVTNGNNVSPLVANGTVTVDVLSGNLAMGQFPLIKYSGTIGGTGGSAFVLGTIEPHALGFISNNVANNSVDLVVTNLVQPIAWAVGNGTWDIAATPNWSNTVPALTTYQQVGTLGDNVVFDDSATGVSPITVTLNVNPTPNSVTFNNASKTYTLSGSGGISGVGSVTKANAGTAFLQTTNTFLGGLNINGGVLNFNSITNLGNGAINFGGGTLQFASGIVDDISARPIVFLSGTGTIDLNGNTVAFANPIGGGGAGGFTLTGSSLQINGTNRYSGNTTINPGSTLTFQSANTYISNSAALIVNGTLNGQADTTVTLSTPVSQILAGSGNIQGEIVMGNNTTISPVTNGTTGTLTINGDLTINGGTLPMDITGASGSPRDSLVINNTGFGSGNLTLGSGLNAGTIALGITGGNLNNGSYSLISYSGSLIGGAGYLRLTGFNQPGQLAYLSSSAPTAGAIQLNVIAANTNSDIWVGGLNANAWDVGTTANWITNGVAGGTFANGNTVTFDDSASVANTTVGLKTSLLPVAMIFSVTNNNYTLQDGSGTGAGVIVGSSSLTINGPTLPTVNTTTILTPNANNGPTTINGSGTTLMVGNGTTTGDMGSGNIANNGTLMFNQTDSHIVVGTISGSGKLVQAGSATLTLGVNNSYTGPTIISNANSVLQVGTGGSVGSLGSGAVTNNGLLIFSRSGNVAATNITGSGSVAFVGGPTITLKNDTYQGGTFITNGSLTLTTNEMIPSAATVAGSTGIFGLGGTLNLSGFNQTVNGLSDLGVNTGLITNTATTNLAGVLITNVLTTGNGVVSNTFTYTGLIGDATNKAAVRLVILGPGNVQLAAANTYRGGTVLGAGVTLTVGGGGGAGINGTTAAGTGSITMSNGTTLFINGNGQTFPAEPVIIAPNSTVTFAAQNLANGFNGTVTGDASSTNIIVDTAGQGVTAQNANGNGPHQWDAFPGTVQIANGGELRLYSNPGPVGGTNTTFDVEGTGVLHVRTTEFLWAGALIGNGNVTGPQSGGANVGNIVVGSKNTDCSFEGNVTGNNNIYKTGTGRFTLDGVTNTILGLDGSGNTITNYVVTNFVSYVGATTVSNGVLAIIAPNSFNGTNFTGFNLAGSSAVLDISSAGYSPDGTNIVTNSVLTLVSPQTLNGYGTIRGSVVAGSGTTVSVGFSANTNNTPVTGLLTITNGIELGGAVNINLSRTSSPNSGEIVSPTITIDGTATLFVTNIGPGLFNGDTFTLFSKPVSGFASVTLPTTDPTGATNYVWTTNLAVNGSITLASGGLPAINPNPTNIVLGVTNGNLYMSWPTDHIGWFLQAQTNLLSAGLKTNWVNVTGSDQTNLVVMPVNPTNPAVFYRMIH